MDGPSNSAQLVLLHFGRTRLALSQRVVRSLEATADVEFGSVPPPALGAIATTAGRWPVYALDEELEPLRHVPRARRICALLATEGGLFGVLCDEAQVLARQGLTAYPLPLAMRRAGTPVEGVLDGAGVALLTSARALAIVVNVGAGLAPAGEREDR
ncbi:MAG TPA: hypothetical protein VMG60_11270 [Burkholderiaceae bacterium]|nr:hypothetical protein [Burkholderiaceae bacterium]